MGSNKKIITKFIIIFVLVIIIAFGAMIAMKMLIKPKDDTQNNTSQNQSNIEDKTNIEEPKKEIKMLDMSSIKEIKCDTSNDKVINMNSVKKYYTKSKDGIADFSAFELNANISINDIYNIQKVENGVILFYITEGRSYIEEFDENGISTWKNEIVSGYAFYDQLVEVPDGYFMLGTDNATYDGVGINVSEGNHPFVFKIDKEGNSVAANLIEKDVDSMSKIIFVQSENNNQDNALEVMVLNNEGNNCIIKYDKDVNQERILETKLENIECKKVIKQENNYYGFGLDASQRVNKGNKILFKIDEEGKEIFKYTIQDNEELNPYLLNYNGEISDFIAIDDMAVNNNYIFIEIDNDVYALDLEGSLKVKFGYSGRTIGSISCKNNDLYVCFGTISEKIIDKISSELVFEYRVEFNELDRLSTKPPIGTSAHIQVLGSNVVDIIRYSDNSIVICNYNVK